MTDCIIGTGTIRADGYCVRRINGDLRYAHRVVWEEQHGEIPVWHTVHHTCHNRACVNIDHLQVMTASEHGRLHADPVTVCPKCGSGERRAIRTRPGKTYCVPCTRERDRARRHFRSMDAAQTRQAMNQ